MERDDERLVERIRLIGEELRELEGMGEEVDSSLELLRDRLVGLQGERSRLEEQAGQSVSEVVKRGPEIQGGPVPGRS